MPVRVVGCVSTIYPQFLAVEHSQTDPVHVHVVDSVALTQEGNTSHLSSTYIVIQADNILSVTLKWTVTSRTQTLSTKYHELTFMYFCTVNASDAVLYETKCASFDVQMFSATSHDRS